jgi:hypothetical protein
MGSPVDEPFRGPELQARSDFACCVQQFGVAGEAQRVVECDAGILVKDGEHHHRR